MKILTVCAKLRYHSLNKRADALEHQCEKVPTVSAYSPCGVEANLFG